MSNVLNEQIKQQIIALGRLGWSLRRIQKSTGVRRETAATYLREAGVAVRAPGLWGRGSPVADPLPATATEADSGLPGAKPAIAVTTDFGAELATEAGSGEAPFGYRWSYRRSGDRRLPTGSAPNRSAQNRPSG